MLLQPIFENAIRHGIEPLKGSGEINISGTLSNGELHLTIEDNGVGRKASTVGGTGIGLKAFSEKETSRCRSKTGKKGTITGSTD